MATLPNVAHYIDIPLQHVHPDLLRAMNRPGDGESYMKLIEKLRKAMPDIAIRTTFIVGFPGESEAHFEALLQFVKAVELDRVGAFIFSPEPETVAARLDGQVPEDVKIERYERLMELQSEVSLKLNRRMIGKSIDVLVEGWDEVRRMWVGRSYRDAPEIDGVVYLKGGDGLKEGMFVEAVVEDAGTYDLVAKALPDGVRK
jgi:ribosomal protein S12 methylthiotransferase